MYMYRQWHTCACLSTCSQTVVYWRLASVDRRVMCAVRWHPHCEWLLWQDHQGSSQLVFVRSQKVFVFTKVNLHWFVVLCCSGDLANILQIITVTLRSAKTAKLSCNVIGLEHPHQQPIVCTNAGGSFQYGSLPASRRQSSGQRLSWQHHQSKALLLHWLL